MKKFATTSRTRLSENPQRRYTHVYYNNCIISTAGRTEKKRPYLPIATDIKYNPLFDLAAQFTGRLKVVKKQKRKKKLTSTGFSEIFRESMNNIRRVVHSLVSGHFQVDNCRF